MNYYKDIERDKYVLKMEKSELTDELKVDLRKVCLWSSFSKSWVSRATLHSNNIKKFIYVMNKYNITEIEEHSLYTSEEIQAKRLECMENRISKLEEKADSLQAEFNAHSGDTAFFTQPNHYNTAKGRAFANYRDRVIENFGKGVELRIQANEKKERLNELKDRLSMKELKENYYTINDVAKILNKTEQTIRNNFIFYEMEEWKNITCADGVYRKVIKKEDFERIYIQNDFNELRKKIKADRLKE